VVPVIRWTERWRKLDAMVGLVGLGLMGTAMSTRLLGAGQDVVGFDVSGDAREAHRARGGEVAGSPADVAARCRVVILSLPSGLISRSVCLDAGGLVEAGRDDMIVVETSTVDPEEVEALGAELDRRGVAFLDAALSGSSDMVARGDTLGMVGGDAPALEVTHPVLSAFCREVRHVGGAGDGMRAKLVVNQILALNRFALAEGLVLAERMGLDLEQTLAVLQASAASSRAMDMWGRRMVERRFDEPVSRIRMHNKDAQVTLAVGRRLRAPMFATAQLNGFVQAALANGMGDHDNSAIIEVLRTLAGLTSDPPADADGVDPPA
jgi:3-hydroxyisobutyrate dehydrogenase-like beta-hydroxyacid dehydrogenase